MKKYKKSGMAVLFGAVAGAALMASGLTVVYTLGTGIVGAVMVVVLVAVAGLTGWVVGWLQSVRKRNHESYVRGFQDGRKEKTLIIKPVNCRHTFAIPDYR